MSQIALVFFRIYHSQPEIKMIYFLLLPVFKR